MWVILVAAIVGMATFLERVFVLRRQKVVPRAFVDRIRGLVARGKLAEALLLCEENESSIARLMVGALRVHARGRDRTEIRSSVDEIAGREISLLDMSVGTSAELCSRGARKAPAPIPDSTHGPWDAELLTELLPFHGPH